MHDHGPSASGPFSEHRGKAKKLLRDLSNCVGLQKTLAVIGALGTVRCKQTKIALVRTMLYSDSHIIRAGASNALKTMGEEQWSQVLTKGGDVDYGQIATMDDLKTLRLLLRPRLVKYRIYSCFSLFSSTKELLSGAEEAAVRKMNGDVYAKIAAAIKASHIRVFPKTHKARESCQIAAVIALALFVCSIFILNEVGYFGAPKTQPVPIPSGIPENLRYGGVYGANDDAMIIPYHTQIELKTVFVELHSCNGIWSGENASIGGVAAQTHTETWDGKLFQGSTSQKAFNAWIQGTIEADDTYSYQWMTLEAKVLVEYPACESYTTYSNDRRSLSRDLKFFVVSPEDYEIYVQNAKWDRFREIQPYEGLILSVLAFMAVFIVVFFYLGAHPMIRKKRVKTEP